MKIHLIIAIVCCLASVSSPASGQENTSADKQAIEKTIASYVKAFNSGDAVALADHWTENGEQISPDGESIKGRENLRRQFSQYFQESKGAKLELTETSVEMMSPNVAVETGIANVLTPGEEPVTTEYRAVHIKTSAGWRVDQVTETEPVRSAPSHYEHLKELEWTIGTWNDSDENSTVQTTCRWTTNRNFISRSFKVMVDDKIDFEGTQVIGWDPAAQTIRSWMFDSDGGFAVGRWSNSGGTWTVKTLSVLADGRRASSTNIYERVDEKTVRYRSIGRQVGEDLLPSIGPITVVREN